MSRVSGGEERFKNGKTGEISVDTFIFFTSVGAQQADRDGSPHSLQGCIDPLLLGVVSGSTCIGTRRWPDGVPEPSASATSNMSGRRTDERYTSEARARDSNSNMLINEHGILVRLLDLFNR